MVTGSPKHGLISAGQDTLIRLWYELIKSLGGHIAAVTARFVDTQGILFSYGQRLLSWDLEALLVQEQVILEQAQEDTGLRIMGLKIHSKGNDRLVPSQGKRK
jgi:hypothetical protein